MDRTADLRRTADLYRRLAEVSTAGGHLEDRLLLFLAEAIDSEANASEGHGVGIRPARRQRASSG
jgi:hypothetical protein